MTIREKAASVRIGIDISGTDTKIGDSVLKEIVDLYIRRLGLGNKACMIGAASLI